MPKIKGFWPAEMFVVRPRCTNGRCVVQCIPVQLTETYDELQRVPQRVPKDNIVGTNKRERPPKESSNGFHADDEGVISKVTGVRQGVLFPKLTKNINLARKVAKVIHKMP